MKDQFVRLIKEEEGQALTEYGLLVGLIAIVAIGAVTLLGDKVSAVLKEIAGKLTK